MADWDAIVLGLGGVGSAALRALAGRGLRALGLEARAVGHDEGSSHGRTRLWRRGYYEHPGYVPLVDRALEGWRALEEESGERLVEPVELLEFGPPQGALIAGVRRSAAEHGVTIEELDRAALAARYGGALHLAEGAVALREGGARSILVERAVRAAARTARERGASLREGVRVRAVEPDGAGFRVAWDGGSARAAAVVVAAGPWSPAWLEGAGVALEVRRKAVFWYEREDGGAEAPALFVEERDGRAFYAFPVPGTRRLKVAEHSGGERVEEPERVERGERPGEREAAEAFLARRAPGWRCRADGHHVCFYTFSADGHFVLDRHPEHPGWVFAAGLSGHGFKFAPVLGELLADLVEGRPEAVPAFLRSR